MMSKNKNPLTEEDSEFTIYQGEKDANKNPKKYAQKNVLIKS